MRKTLLILLFFIIMSDSFGQTPLLENSPLISRINHTLDLIYNFEFDAASDSIVMMRQDIGDHPGLHFLEAMIIYWRDRPLDVGSDMYSRYEGELQRTIDLAEPYLSDKALYVEGNFYKLCGYGFLTDLYSEEGGSFRVIGTARNAYKYLKKGFEMEEEFPDFHFTTGLYNYYREKYPELRPFYKSFMWLFMDGDLKKGLEYLEEAATRGIFTKREAYIYQFHIYARYENNPYLGYAPINYLANRYPRNTRFKCYKIESLFSLDSLEGIVPLIDELKNEEQEFYRLSYTLFQGMYLEQTGQLQESFKIYLEALAISNTMKKRYLHYESMAQAGLARVYDSWGNKDKAILHYKIALDLEPYVPVLEEANQYLGKYDN